MTDPKNILPVTISEDKGQKPILNEVRPVGIWAYHALRDDKGNMIPFLCHAEAAKICVGAMLEEFARETESAPEFGGVDLSQPFCVQVALVKGDTEKGTHMDKLVTVQEQKHMEFAKDLAEQVGAFLDEKIPQLTWRLKGKTGKKSAIGATHVAFYFEFSMREHSASLEALRKVIDETPTKPSKPSGIIDPTTH